MSGDLPTRRSRLPALHGGLLALGAALLFGASTPLVQRAGVGLGPFTTGALLYAGAAALGALLRRPAGSESALRRSDLPRVATMALFGATLGPVALAWGLQHASGTGSSLLLTLEAPFTALLAYALYREAMGPRIWAASGLLVAGACVLILQRGGAGGDTPWGLIAVTIATLAWGVDNTLSRPLAERDPGQVVLAKALMGSILMAVGAWVAGEPIVRWTQAAALLAIGATGYGLSLRLYLLAQRAFGAARTGSVFAFAPFIGAVLAVAIGDRTMGWATLVAGGLMLAGVLLHLAESHDHEHVHEPLQHDHAHSHDDGHHDHVHLPMPVGPHSHPHRHDPVRHAHPHVPDAHHQHTHQHVDGH